MLPILFACATVSMAPSGPWYGPVTVSFPAGSVQSPYDPTVTDARVVFSSRSRREERLAFYADGQWKAVLVARNPGRYNATLTINGQPSAAPTVAEIPESMKLEHGFIRRTPKHRFAWDSGEPYYPVGMNIAWNGGGLTVEGLMARLSASGGNWARVWACHWDGKNPVWPNTDEKVPIGSMWEPALARWDSIVEAAERHKVPFQFVLFHHGQWTTHVNPNWADNPWNTKNGGFLENPADFFTDTRAKQLAKNWLRMAVARYGHSPSVMAWELFNEVEWVNARYDNRWADVEAWHAEMAAYLRSIDPYGRLVTTSSAMERPNLWKAMDYYQPHAYPVDVFGRVLADTMPKDKPGFLGEIGPSGAMGAKESSVVRDAVLGAVLAGHSGAAQYWYWDRFAQLNMDREFIRLTQVVEASGIRWRPDAKPVPMQADVPAGADLVFGPGGGWERTRITKLKLPEDATAANLGKMSAYFQSQTGGNRELFPEPIELSFTAKQAGTFTLDVAGVAKAGAKVIVDVNGQMQAVGDWSASAEDRSEGLRLAATFEPGPVVIRIRNEGADWVVIRSFSVTGIGQSVRLNAVGESDWLFMRAKKSPGAPSGDVTVRLSKTGLRNGQYRFWTRCLDTNAVKEALVTVQDGNLTFPTSFDDSVIRIGSAKPRG